MTKQELVMELDKLNLDSSKVDKLEEYMLATLKANESFNLTAIKDENKFRELMILDSAYPLKYFDFTNSKTIIVIRYNTIDNIGYIKSYKPDRVLIDGNEYKVMIGLIDHDIGFDGVDCILNNKYLEGI